MGVFEMSQYAGRQSVCGGTPPGTRAQGLDSDGPKASKKVTVDAKDAKEAEGKWKGNFWENFNVFTSQCHQFMLAARPMRNRPEPARVQN